MSCGFNFHLFRWVACRRFAVSEGFNSQRVIRLSHALVVQFGRDTDFRNLKVMGSNPSQGTRIFFVYFNTFTKTISGIVFVSALSLLATIVLLFMPSVNGVVMKA